MVRARSTLAALLIALGACIPPPEATQAPTEPAPPARPTTADQVLQRYVVALGGEAALRRLPQRSVEARVIFRDHPQCEADEVQCVDGDLVGSLVLHATADGRLFRRMVVQNTLNERGFDGRQGWTLREGAVLDLEGEDASLATREDALLHWYLDLEAREVQPKLVEPVEEGHDGTARVLDGLRWTASHGKLPEKTMWFDRATGLLREEVESESNPSERMVIVYDDYRPVDGVMVAHAIRQITGDGDARAIVDIVVQRVEHGEVPVGAFEVPSLVPPAPEPDPILLALDRARANVEARPKEARDLLALARVAFAAGHFSEALAAARRVLALVRTEPEASFIAGRAALVSGDLTRARRELDRAVKTGLRPEVHALQMAWLHSAKLDWPAIADAFEAAGLPQLAELYSAAGGPALRLERTRACSSRIPAHPEAESGRVAVEVSIEGTPARMMIDTGTRDVLLGKSFAGSILATREVDAPLGTGGPALPHAYLEDLTIGDFTLSNVPAAIVGDASLQASAAGVDGVIGVRPLLRFLVAVDAPARELRLVLGERRCARDLAAERSGARAPMILHESHYLYTIATIGPSEAVLALNTGIRGTDVALNSGAFARAGVGPPPMIDGAPTPARLTDVAIGEIALGPWEAAYGAFEEEVTTDQFRIDGLLGIHAFGPRRIVIDLPGRSLYVRASAADPETP